MAVDFPLMGQANATEGNTVQDPLLSLLDVAAYLSTSKRRVRELLAAGELGAVRDGRLVKVRQSEVDRYVAELPAWEPAS